MPKAIVAVAALAAMVLFTAVASLVDGASAQAAASPFEYLRVTPFSVSIPIAPNQISFAPGYRACVAAATEWTCREFRPETVSDSALRTVLATLGNEGWELVSAVKEDGPTSALTYLFKRQARVMP